MRTLPLGICIMATLLGAGCGHAPRAGRPASRCSRYQVGDFVVYRTIQRRARRVEMFHLLERVDEKRCQRLVIHDWLVSGAEAREWKMHLTDTPENQRNNVADAVYVRTSGGWQQAPTSELGRLFATGVDVDGKTRLVGLTGEQCDVAGRSYPCRVKRTEGTVGGVPVRVVCRRSKAFLWTNIGCEFTRTKDGGPIFTMEVVDAGRVAPGEIPTRWQRLFGRGSAASVTVDTP